MIALLENFQDAGGAVSVPEPLWDFGAPRSLGGERGSG
jgi:seryl-tRNA synthetase